MEISEIARLGTAMEMRREVLKIAMERNVPEKDVWMELEIYRRKHPESGPKSPMPVSKIIKDVLPSKNEVTITESPIEERLKRALQRKGINFVTQQKIGRYRVDFFFPDGNLVVEADGQEYHSKPDQRQNDMDRDFEIAGKGYNVLRFRGNQIYKDLETCVDKISLFLEHGKETE